jgi:hypothetical protein
MLPGEATNTNCIVSFLFGLLPRQDPLSEYHMYANPTDVTISKPQPGADPGFQVRGGRT